MRIGLGVVAGIAALAAAAGYLVAGPLTPPVGPVASSYRTLTEVEPRTPISAATTPGDADSLFKITQPGSYYLTGNVAGVAGKSGIEIASSDVSIDLGGFELRGVAGSLSGIVANIASGRGVSIRHGQIRGWGSSGIDCFTDFASGSFSDIRALENGGDGIRVGRDCTVIACTATGNTGRGILVSTNSTLRDCAASSNNVGFQLSGANTITNCTSTQSVTFGIFGGAQCVIQDCSCFFSGTEGIVSDNGSHIVGNAVLGSGTNGVRVTYGCTVRENTLRQNGNSGVGAGINVSGSNNRIDSNNCTFADRGIEVTNSGNFITRNTCAANTANYVIFVNNVCLVVNATLSPAISGSSGGVSPGSTDPNANFSF